MSVLVAQTLAEDAPAKKEKKGGGKRHQPKCNTAKAPKNATVLFDGKDTSKWTTLDGKPCPWKIDGDALACVPKTGSIKTKDTFGDGKLHIEFKPPLMAEAKKGSQERGNSGVYIQGRYEIQVLDSYDIGRPTNTGDCGALYSLIAPSKNASLPPNEWQSFDITFQAPKFDNGKLTTKGRITVVQNGVVIIKDAEIPKVTPGGLDGDEGASKAGPLMLQDHGNTVAYRNIWIQPHKAK